MAGGLPDPPPPACFRTYRNGKFLSGSVTWKTGVHQGETYPDGGNPAFHQGKHQAFAWWRVWKIAMPDLAFFASPNPGRFPPGFPQGKGGVYLDFPQGKTRVFARGKSATHGIPPGKHQVFTR